jgi:hypothetical protein
MAQLECPTKSDKGSNKPHRQTVAPCGSDRKGLDAIIMKFWIVGEQMTQFRGCVELTLFRGGPRQEDRNLRRGHTSLGQG